MQASAYQQMRKEIDQLQRALAQRDQHIGQLTHILQHKDQTILGLQLTVAAVAFSGAPSEGSSEVSRPARRRWLKRKNRARASTAMSERQSGAVRVPKALIEEMSKTPLHFEPKQHRDEATGDVTFTTRRRTAAELAELDAKMAEEQKAQEAKAVEEAQAATIVAPDGRPAREAEKSKILIVQ